MSHSCKELGGRLRKAPLWVSLLRTVPDPPSQLMISGCKDDDDSDDDK